MGVLVGIIPGLGPLQVLALMFGLFQGWNPMELIIFYIGLITVSQYVDSIPAVYLGVPGETGAIPTAYESRFITSWNQKNQIIKYSALGRAIGCMIAVVFTLMVIENIKSVPILFSARVQIWLFAIAILGIALTSKNKFWITITLMFSGYFLGMVGYNFYLDKEVLTFGIAELYNGLPVISVIMGIYVVPSLLDATKQTVPIVKSTKDEDRLMPFRKFLPTITRSSVLGYFLGLVPGVSYILSSNASYNLEKWIHRKKYQPGHSQSCVACETGNSVGAYSTLIPLLFFGVPITISESLIYDLMLQAGVIFQQGQFLTDNLWSITGAFLVCSLIALICSWPLAKFFLSMFRVLNNRALYVVVIAFCVVTVGVIGWNENRLLTYLVSFVLLLIPGIYLKQKDTLPLIFVFIMQNSIESTISNLVNLIF